MPQPFIRSRKRGVGTDFIPPPPSGDTSLRIGFFGMTDLVGRGPGGSTSKPYKVAHWSPHASNSVADDIALATQKDIILLAPVGGPPTSYGATEHRFSLDRYKQQLDRLFNTPAYNAAAGNGRIHSWVADEPNIDIWAGTFTPTLMASVAVENKLRWPKCLTHARVTPTLLRSGWDGQSVPAAGYTKLDYGWMQYNAAHRRAGRTFAQAMSQEKTAAEALDIGVTASVNLANCGIRADMDTVTACWDYDRSVSTPTGVVIGQPAGSGYFSGQGVACDAVSTIPNSQNILANPDWIRRLVAVAAADADIPFLLFWTLGSSFLDPFTSRSDFVSALNDAMTTAAARASFNGFREPK